MDSVLKTMIIGLKKKPRLTFLIDCIGAFITAFILFAILRNGYEYIGIPKTTLTALALIAFCFCIYSAACFIFVKQHYRLFLWIISIANLFYCILTIGFIVVNYPFITMMGLSYFLIEVIIISILSYVEIKVASVINEHSMYNNW
jgi:hypothetical protein